MEYEELLKRGRDRMPEAVVERERFEVPKVVGHLEGNKTVITNFLKIADTLRRDPDHLLKFVLHELATPGVIRNGMLIVGTKTNAGRINEKIKQYAHEFVLCPECGKPDTTIVSDGETASMRCQACGHKKPVKAKI